MIDVRIMSEEDIPFAASLTDTMNWELVREDFHFMLSLEPNGCLVAWEGGERVGLSTTLSYKDLGWLGNLIVSKDFRRRGIGYLLVKNSVEYLTGKGVKTVGIYSYVDKIPFYKKCGFESDGVLTVLRGRGKKLTDRKSSVEEVGKRGLEEVVAMDCHCFGAPRRRLLEAILSSPKNLCHISRDDRGIQGFAVTKVYEGAAEIGPLACYREQSGLAKELLKAILGRLRGYRVTLCVPEKEKPLHECLLKMNFREDFRVVRMFHGNPVNEKCLYIPESLERG